MPVEKQLDRCGNQTRDVYSSQLKIRWFGCGIDSQYGQLARCPSTLSIIAAKRIQFCLSTVE